MHLDPIYRTVPECIQPLIFDSQNLEYAYGVIGTGFFAVYDAQIFFLTARHCLGKTTEEVKQNIHRLCLPISPTQPDLVPLKSWSESKSNSELGNEVLPGGTLDVVVIQINQQELWVEKALLPRCVSLPIHGGWLENMENHLIKSQDSSEGPLAEVRGFPASGTSTNIDYDDKHIVTQHAVYLGRIMWDRQYPHTRRIDFLPEYCPVQELNGISGAPVFVRYKEEDSVFYTLAGMMIRGGNLMGHFVTVRWLVEIVKAVLHMRR